MYEERRRASCIERSLDENLIKKPYKKKEWYIQKNLMGDPEKVEDLKFIETMQSRLQEGLKPGVLGEELFGTRDSREIRLDSSRKSLSTINLHRAEKSSTPIFEHTQPYLHMRSNSNAMHHDNFYGDVVPKRTKRIDSRWHEL